MLNKFSEQQAYFLVIRFPFELLPERNPGGIPLQFPNGLSVVIEEFLKSLGVKMLLDFFPCILTLTYKLCPDSYV